MPTKEEYWQNRAETLQKKREWNKAHPEALRKYREKAKLRPGFQEWQRNYYRQWRAAHRAEQNQKARERYHKLRLEIKNDPKRLAEYRLREQRRHERWCARHPKRAAEIALQMRRRLRQVILAHYSKNTMKCARCGYDNIIALTVDHISGGGTKHRRDIGKGEAFYHWLKRNNFPEGFQILCANCQLIKRAENHEWYL